MVAAQLQQTVDHISAKTPETEDGNKRLKIIGIIVAASIFAGLSITLLVGILAKEEAFEGEEYRGVLRDDKGNKMKTRLDLKVEFIAKSNWRFFADFQFLGEGKEPACLSEFSNNGAFTAKGRSFTNSMVNLKVYDPFAEKVTGIKFHCEFGLSFNLKYELFTCRITNNENPAGEVVFKRPYNKEKLKKIMGN